MSGIRKGEKQTLSMVRMEPGHIKEVRLSGTMVLGKEAGMLKDPLEYIYREVEGSV